MPVTCTIRCEQASASDITNRPKTCLGIAGIYNRTSLPDHWLSLQIAGRSLTPYTFCSMTCLALWLRESSASARVALSDLAATEELLTEVANV